MSLAVFESCNVSCAPLIILCNVGVGIGGISKNLPVSSNMLIPETVPIL